MEKTYNGAALGRKALSVAAIILLLALLASVAWSKYTGELSGSDEAAVASFKVSAGDLGTTEQTVDLFSTIYDTNGTSDYTTASPAAESDVAPAKLAPGTWGKFPVTLKNESDVKVHYKLSCDVQDASTLPLEFSFDGTSWAAPAALSALEGDLAIGSSAAQTADKVVYWRWAIGKASGTDEEKAAVDESDTALGSSAAEGTLATAPKASIKAIFTQVD